MSQASIQETSSQQDRRQHHHVREIFEDACQLIAPFFATENRWGNATLDHLAYRVIREHYPELAFGEVHVLVVAAKRLHSGHTPQRDLERD